MPNTFDNDILILDILRCYKYIYDKGEFGGFISNGFSITDMLDGVAPLWKSPDEMVLEHQNNTSKAVQKTDGKFYSRGLILDDVSKLLPDKYSTLLDPSCGVGDLLCLALKDEVKLIHGIDIDLHALLLTGLRVYDSGYRGVIELTLGDGLFCELERNYDLIIGNPPYLGHKRIDKDYRVRLKEGFNVYTDKADIYYCFFERYLKALKPKGFLVFIVSRYFLESSNGAELRNFILNYSILDVIDYYGNRLMKGISVDPLIIKLGNELCLSKINVSRHYPGTVLNFEVSKDRLKKDFLLFPQEHLSILDRMRRYLPLSLYVHSFQGIITGCDRAFVRDKDYTSTNSMPWIKSKDIHKGRIEEPSYKILYITDNIEPDSKEMEELSMYKDALSERRECKKGIRKWQSIQWYRDIDMFSKAKIIYRYKSKDNCFALDYTGALFSADIYAIAPVVNFDLEFLTDYLNSTIVEFYIKSIAKKLGDDLYEYYPNKILTVPLPLELQSLYLKGSIEKREGWFDRLVLDFYGVSDTELAYITDFNSGFIVKGED